jgi:hypothetical protein
MDLAVTQPDRPQSVTIANRSPHLDPATVETVITIPTFRRPQHLLRTLDSVARQCESAKTAIIVVENEATEQAGAKACAASFDTGDLNGLVIVAHDQGNCHAYNGAWITALEMLPALKWVAVIDDDELASEHWLSLLQETAARFGADLVGGPQIPFFEGVVSERLKAHPVFQPHYDATGPVPALFSSGNLLVSADVLRAMPFPFLDPVFNFTGGGDADFMRRAKAAGFTFAWCNEAPVIETIPENRVTQSWITKRALRNGQLSALIEHRARAGQPLGRLRTIAHTLILAGASLPRAALRLVRTRSPLAALYPIHIAAGRIASEFGYANEQYRNPQD